MDALVALEMTRRRSPVGATWMRALVRLAARVRRHVLGHVPALRGCVGACSASGHTHADQILTNAGSSQFRGSLPGFSLGCADGAEGCWYSLDARRRRAALDRPTRPPRSWLAAPAPAPASHAPSRPPPAHAAVLWHLL
eukprot:COSAG01_NODE_2592_length_7414_cov_6.421787_6_plen_139_part_00